MPEICDLDRLRARLCYSMPVASAAITRHNGDPGVADQPCLDNCLLAVG
jgi:hypothetical protein